MVTGTERNGRLGGCWKGRRVATIIYVRGKVILLGNVYRLAIGTERVGEMPPQPGGVFETFETSSTAHFRGGFVRKGGSPYDYRSPDGGKILVDGRQQTFPQPDW